MPSFSVFIAYFPGIGRAVHKPIRPAADNPIRRHGKISAKGNIYRQDTSKG